MKTLASFFGFVFYLTALGHALTQEAEPFDPELYRPFGNLERGVYDPNEEGIIGAGLLVTVTSPSGQGVDVVVVGPNGFRRSVEVEDREVIEVLHPGVYAIAATDDSLQMVGGVVEVHLEEVLLIAIDVTPAADGPEFDEDAYRPYGNFQLGAYELGNTADEVGSLAVTVDLQGRAGDDEPIHVAVVGPNDEYHSLSGSAVLDDLGAGVYSVAATAEGYRVTQGFVEVRAGEVVSVSLVLVPYGM